jgi:deazaflavin-dependent oxidoreductase (nitroreductase family)
MHSPNPEAVTAPPSRSRAIALSRRFLGPIWLRVGFVAVLTVPGRHSGTPHRVTLFPVEVDATWYLLSQYGVSEWVRNLRAAGRGELRRKGRTQAFNAVEVDGGERDRAIAAFHAKTPKQFTSDFDQRPDAADHPTFRVEPTS